MIFADLIHAFVKPQFRWSEILETFSAMMSRAQLQLLSTQRRRFKRKTVAIDSNGWSDPCFRIVLRTYVV